MSDIGVAEIPVDEDERPLPLPETPIRNALVDGPILRTLLWLAWPNVVALSAGTCVVIAETSYIGALGAGNVDRASTLAAHAMLIGICFGLTFMRGMLIFGPALLELLGGRGKVLADAIGYSQIFFGGAVLPWLMNSMTGILRGTGNMKLPSLMILSSAVCQIILGGTLGLGLAPIPQFGMREVGAVSCLSPLQSVLTISIFTHMLAGFGTAILAGYGIGARLEFMLTSLAFATGIASVPMIGMAIGAGRIARARRIAWTAGLVSFVSVGLIGSLLAIFPDLWVNIFTGDASVRAASRQYLSTAAPMYAFIGLAISMFFSSQGAAKVVGPVLAQSARLLFIAGGGWWLSMHNATAANFFALAAASMVVLGTLSAASVFLTRWGPKRAPVAEISPALSGVID